MKLKKQKNLLEELVAELEETNAQLNQLINDQKLAEKKLGRNFDIQSVISVPIGDG